MFQHARNDSREIETLYIQNGQVQIYGSKCLDVTNGLNADGTKLQVWDCEIPSAINQQFGYTAFGDNQWVHQTKKKIYIGSILIVISITWANSSRCVDLPNGNLSDGNQVQILVCNGAEDNNTQIWDVGYM